MNSVKSAFTLILLIVLLVSLTGCIQQPKSSEKINVVTSFYPLYEFSKRIGGEKAEVSVLVPAGAEPHDWEPGPQDIIKVESAQIFVYNGAGLEPYIDKIITKTESQKLIVVDSSEGIELIKEGGTPDPHIWLDPVLAKHQADAIEKAFIKADPKNSDYYTANAQALRQDLDALGANISKELAPAKKKVFITAHAAFGYFAKRYGLTQIAIAGLSPDIEPSPAKIVEIVKLAQENKVKYIFFETLVSPKLSETIAKEAGAQTLALNPIEGLSEGQIKQGENYFTLMRKNVKNLKLALDVENG
ncbi:MAG: metal ABC transporter substrate-binding protein [Candidatus Methanoperedens sp.]|nr:metal ABC transporter substrate-binding protein [Candidatus Methanoperedens sp.]MCZ7371910.1 metal ABC transporter substrate-binding protein [Candidatus Methanoperedens sp.]